MTLVLVLFQRVYLEASSWVWGACWMLIALYWIAWGWWLIRQAALGEGKFISDRAWSVIFGRGSGL